MTELLARSPAGPGRAVFLAAAAFLTVLVLTTLVLALAPASGTASGTSSSPVPDGWRTSPPLARAPGAGEAQEERLLAAYRALGPEPAARAAFVASLAADYGAVSPGKRAVLGEAALGTENPAALDPAGLIAALWALEELEAAPEALVVEVDTLAGLLVARRAAPGTGTLQVATLPRTALTFDAAPATTTDRRRALWLGLVLATVAGGTVLFGLRAARGESPERMREREDFFYAVTHELKTPLTTIALCAETLQLHGRDDPAAVPRFAATIRDEAERLQGRIHQVLQLAAARVPGSFGGQSFDAASALPAIVAEYVATARQAGVRLVLLADGSDWIVAGSVELFAQALGGLLENAIRLGQPGVVRIAARAEHGALHISVQDEGPGVPPELVPTLFTPRPRPEPGAPRASSGLGLAFVRQSVEALGGSIRLDPGTGRGATFRFVVPLTARPSRTEEPA